MKDDKQKIELVTVTDLADYFGRDVRTIQLWVEDGMPRLARGKYNKDACIKWRIKKLEEEVDIAKNSGDENINELRKQEMAITNKTKEIKLKLDLLQVVDKRTVLIAWSNQNSVINSKLDTLVNDLLREVKENLTPEQAQKMRNYFNETKESIAALTIEDYIIDEDKIHTDEEKETE